MGRAAYHARFSPSIAVKDESSSLDEVLITLREIIVAGVALTEILNSRLPSPDACGQAIFALRTIQAAGRRGLSQADIARALGLSAPATTRLIDHLQKDGLAVRGPHPSDRRVNVITLSERGAGVLSELSALLADDKTTFPERIFNQDNSFNFQLSTIVKSSDSILRLRP